MKIGVIIPFLFFMIITACRKETDSIPLIASYCYYYMDYPQNVSHDTSSLIYLEYSGDRVISRRGGIIPTNPASGYNYIYFGNVIDELAYSGNTISITTKSVSNGQVSFSDDTRILFKDKLNRMEREIYSYRHNYYIDTTDYKYDGAGYLIESHTHGLHHAASFSFYYYNSESNLDSIITNTIANDLNIGKMVETFSDYDTAPNPLRKLAIFKETFHRALCENNYRQYQMHKYDENNNLIATSLIVWRFPYDNKGTPLFNKSQE